jgi:hypothetical protein
LAAASDPYRYVEKRKPIPDPQVATSIICYWQIGCIAIDLFPIFPVLILHVMTRILALVTGRKRSLQNLKISYSGHILYQNVPPIYAQQCKEWFSAYLVAK